MHRWNLLLPMALLAAVLIALSGARAAGATSTNFKGKASVYYRNSGPYFVVNFTCTNAGLSGNWTYDTRMNSYSGTLGTTGNLAPCALVTTDNPGWSSSSSPSGSASPFGSAGCSLCIPLQYSSNGSTSTVGYLALKLLNIMATKTYVSDTSDPSESGTCPNNSSSPPACIQITTHPNPNVPAPWANQFDSTVKQPLTPTGSPEPYNDPYGTLNITLP